MENEPIINIMAITFIIGCVLIYFLPMVIAIVRGCKREWMIIMLLFIAGWTVIGWITAFVWACIGQQKDEENVWS